MIRFQLCCDADHEFDGWFRNGDDFDVQKKRGLVSCPVCHSAKVEKMLMAPAVSTGRKKETMALAMGEQQRRRRHTSQRRRVVQRRVSVTILGARVGAGTEEQPRDGRLATRCGEV